MVISLLLYDLAMWLTLKALFLHCLIFHITWYRNHIQYKFFLLAHLIQRIKSANQNVSVAVVVIVVTFHIFIFFSRTTGLILTKLGTKYLKGKGFQVCSFEGPVLLQRGDNQDIVKIGWGDLKIFFLRTEQPVTFKL